MTHLLDSYLSIAPAFMSGLALSFGLIVAIGAQNAFVLRQGLRREHVGSVVVFCALADAVLIAAGVWGMAKVLGEHPALARALAGAGSVFLATYSFQALRRATRPQSLEAASSGAAVSQAAILGQAAAFTLLNPHVYLDTVLLVGSIGAQQPTELQRWLCLAPVLQVSSGLRCWVLVHGGWPPGLPAPRPGKFWMG